MPPQAWLSVRPPRAEDRLRRRQVPQNQPNRPGTSHDHNPPHDPDKLQCSGNDRDRTLCRCSGGDGDCAGVPRVKDQTGFPMNASDGAMLEADEIERYARHLVLHEVGGPASVRSSARGCW